MLQPNEIVDHYRVVRLVGRGGMGEVYLARDTVLGRRVALKVIHPRHVGTKEAVAQFLQEARLTATLSHPHIVTVYGAGEHHGNPYLSLEFLSGQTLRQRMDEDRPGVRESVRIVVAVAKALEEAHRHGIVHRDLKPENILLPKDGRPRVLDLGLATVVELSPSPVVRSRASSAFGQQQAEPDPDPDPDPTPDHDPDPDPDPASDPARQLPSALAGVSIVSARRGTVQHGSESAQDSQDGFSQAVDRVGLEDTGSLLGTPAYMAPEQWCGERATAAVDVWALGVILFELLIGRRPFVARAVNELRELVSGPLPPPAVPDLPGVPADLAACVGHCLEKDPLERPPVAQVVARLEQVLAGGRSRILAERNPFRGLLPFAERHSELFFGRDEETAAFLEAIREHPVLPVVGPSGAGKSSFVQAGVVPRLREQGAWTVLTIRPGADPFATLAARLDRGQSGKRWNSTEASLHTVDFDRPPEPPPDSADSGVGPPGSLARRLCESPRLLNLLLAELAETESSRVLLFVDQLEEAYTLVADERLRRRFMEAVCAAADDPLGAVRVVFTIRDDFLGRVAEGAEVRDALGRVVVLRSPGPDALVETLVRPLESLGYGFDDPDLPAEMVASVKGEPACLPLLQFALKTLWEKRDRNKRLIQRSSYVAAGGVAGALAEHADGVLDVLSVEQLGLARALLLRLVTAEGTRRVVPMSLALEGLGIGAREVLTRLTQARLVTVRKGGEDSGGGGCGGGGSGWGGVGIGHGGDNRSEAMLELVHESLVKTWSRLARWIEESHEELVLLGEVSQAAELWDRRGRPLEEVWQGKALGDARTTLERCAGRVPALVAGFLAAGVRREQRRQWRKRAAMLGSLLLLVGITVSAVLVAEKTRQERDRALWQRAEAQNQGARAATLRGNLLEARALLRGSLDSLDSPLARALWWKLERE
ncbi:MAG: serine/threonine-protein kinase, partial [Pseudomonadota bacterium]